MALVLLLVGCSSDDGDAGNSNTSNGNTVTSSTTIGSSSSQSSSSTSSTSGANTATSSSSSTMSSTASSSSSTSSGGTSGTTGTLTTSTGASGTSGGGAGGTGTTTGGTQGPTPGSILIQDNFDTAAAGMPPDAGLWEGYPQGQESLGPVVDSMKAKSGGNSARVMSTSSGLGSFLVPASGSLGGSMVTGNAFYVRVHMNWQKATTEVSGHSAFIVGAVARDNSGTEARLGLSSKGPNNVPRVDLNLQSPSDGAGGEVTRYSNGFTDGGNPADFPDLGFQFAADTWYCVEAYFDGTASASEFRLWIDGSEIEAMHVTDFSANGSGRTSWGPTYQYIKIGAQDYDANLGQIWYDDVVVATEPIGCDYVVP